MASPAERIEAGWFDNGFITRDYFVAQAEDRNCYWIYFERVSSRAVADERSSAGFFTACSVKRAQRAQRIHHGKLHGPWPHLPFPPQCRRTTIVFRRVVRCVFHLAGVCRAVLLFQFHVPAWRFACGGTGRARIATGLRGAGHHRRMFARRCRARARRRRRKRSCRCHRLVFPSAQCRTGRPAFGLILLAQNRDGYGNLSELITLARTRSDEGQLPADAARPRTARARHTRICAACPIAWRSCAGLPGQRGGARRARSNGWTTTFPGRAWVGLTLHQRAMDDIHRGTVEYVAGSTGLPVVAPGNVVMHVRSRKPLQDTLTRDSPRQAGRRMRLRSGAECRAAPALAAAAGEPVSARRAGRNTEHRWRAARFSLDELRYEYPDELVPRGLTRRRSYLRQRNLLSGAHRRFPQGSRTSAGADRARTGADRAN